MNIKSRIQKLEGQTHVVVFIKPESVADTLEWIAETLAKETEPITQQTKIAQHEKINSQSILP